MSITIKKLLRILAPAKHSSRVWQRHSALLKLAAKQHGRAGV